LKRLASLLAAAGCLAMLVAHGAERTKALPHAHAGWANEQNDLGETDPNLRLTHLVLVLNRSPERQQAFEALLRDQQDPKSADFHRWLTPAEIGERFGVADEDIAALEAWLESKGLHVDGVASSRVRIEFSGRAAQVGAAFGTLLHSYAVDGSTLISPLGTPQIPESLAPIVQSVHGLQSIRSKPHSHQEVREMKPASDGEKATVSCSSGACTYYVAPADFAAIYNLNPVYQQGINGSGQTIAIIGRSSVYMADIENFQKRVGLSVKDPVVIIPPNGIDPGTPASTNDGTDHGDQVEATIDVTRATSVAPGATIQLVISANGPSTNGLGVAIQYVLNANSAQVMSISFGGCERNNGPSAVSFWNSLFSQAAAQGISVFVSSGDSGAAACDKSFTSPPTTQSLSTNDICASGYATCVGGTQFNDTTNPASYWSTSNGAGLLSATGYIPEGAWNEPLNSSGNVQVAATGGGMSVYVPTPSWQTGPGVPSLGGRYVPDVSFTSAHHDGYFNCFAAGGGSCVPASNGSFSFSVAAGTSAAAPSMAGIAALLNQKMGGAQGHLNPCLYALAATPANGVFHDITVTTSGVGNCDTSFPSLCNNSNAGPTALTGGLAGYTVGPGYDMVTGLGSINVANLFANWSSNGPPNTPGPLSGLWWNPNESGWGIDFTQRRNIIFAAWYTYDASGNPKWYVASSCTMANANVTSGTCNGTLFEVNGPNFFGGAFESSKVNVTTAGTLAVNFQDANNASLTYTLGTQTRTVPITRQPISGGSIPGVDYTDLWYNAAESGWGLAIAQQGSVMFLAWYVYDSSGKPMWFVASNCAVSGTSCTGALFRTTGPAFGPTFDSTAVHVTQVGTVSVNFSDPNNGVLSYTVNGVTATKNITRQAF